MSALKTWALFVPAWCAMATLAQADPGGGFSDWTVWSAESHVVNGNAGGAQIIPSKPDVYLNFGTSPYAEESALTSGSAQPWYTSPSYTKFFNGAAPSAADEQKFINDVKQDVQTTLEASGLKNNNEVFLTTNLADGAAARHAMSIVSNTSYAPNPNAIGITDVGANGFSFIDKLSYASSVSELEWAVAHNLSHEIMHAFGVGYHPDETGAYLDAATATWSLLTNPGATLSPAALQAILDKNIGRNGSVSGSIGSEGLMIDGDQEILAPVPEPSTIAFWSLAATALLYHQRRRAMRRRAA
jgi:hypothetical protein